jgi:hypothetical protein
LKVAIPPQIPSANPQLQGNTDTSPALIVFATDVITTTIVTIITIIDNSSKASRVAFPSKNN